MVMRMLGRNREAAAQLARHAGTAALCDGTVAVVDGSAELRPYEPQVQRAGEFSLEMAQRTDDELRLLTGVFRQRLAGGEPLHDLVPRAFATVSEAVIRAGGTALGKEHLLAGAALAEGAIVDMKDGEGKSLTAVLPAYLHALAGQGVHVACLDGYLAHRDAVRAAAILGVLGMSVGLTTSSMETGRPRARRTPPT